MSPRFPCNLDTSCTLIASVEGEAQPVKVRNISAGGISLIVPRGFEPHSVLTLQLVNKLKNYRCDVRIRVIYCLEHPTGEWILGAAFTRNLTDEELRAFLK
ncbi:MAG: PilZ domain-containing protein [Gemmataceae bacterium]